MMVICDNCGQKTRKAAIVDGQQRCPKCVGIPESVNHPSHYGGDVPHEVIKCLEAWGLEGEALLWNAVKYIARSSKKGRTLEDLKKARFYLDRRISRMEGN